jgi:hypothetical protein
MNARNDVKTIRPEFGCEECAGSGSTGDLLRGLIFSWLAGSSDAPRTSRLHNGCSGPIGSPHVSSGGREPLHLPGVSSYPRTLVRGGV